MQYKKSYDHLHVEVDTAPAKVAPSSTPPTPAPQSASPTSKRPVFQPKTSIIPRVIIIGLIALIVYLGYSLMPKNFRECERFPGSKVSLGNGDTCRTFYGALFTETNLLTGALPTSTPRPSATPTKDLSIPPELQSGNTTKGGLPLEEEITPTIKNGAPTPKPATRNSQPATIIPTPTPVPNSGSTPTDWVRHRYPDQSLTLYLPKGWVGSDAVRSRDTGITTFTLGGSSVQVTLAPNWNNTGNAQEKAINYEVAGVSAIKVTGNTTTTVYWQRSNIVYSLACQNSLWNTCDTILKSLAFTN